MLHLISSRRALVCDGRYLKLFKLSQTAQIVKLQRPWRVLTKNFNNQDFLSSDTRWSSSINMTFGAVGTLGLIVLQKRGNISSLNN